MNSLTRVPDALRVLVEHFMQQMGESGYGCFVTAIAGPDGEGEFHRKFGHEVVVESGTSRDGTLRAKFGYLKPEELAAAEKPDLSIGIRYNPAACAKRFQQPMPAALDCAARALQHNYFRVGAEYEPKPEELRMLFVRGNWHPQVNDMTQGVLVDVRWIV